MTNGEAVNWLINISADIGRAEHRDLWHYEQALSEIREILETAQPEVMYYPQVDGVTPSVIAQPERKKGEWIRHDEIKNVYGGIYIECSECGEKYVVQHIEDEKYCRNCGADMRGDFNEIN